MALIHCDFASKTLGLCTSMDVILPQESAGPHPCLWLLHGLSDDHTIWQRRTAIERYVEPLKLAVVMPQVGRSFYTDMNQGGRYWTFVSEELPQIVRTLFPVSARREDNFAAGNSMGGYGAFKLAMRCPDRFAAAASLSGALDLPALIRAGASDAERVKTFRLIFGPDLKVAAADDLFECARRLADRLELKPLLYQACGTGDFLYVDNVHFRDLLRSLGLPVTYEENPGSHDWGYWDQQIQRVLNWLPIQKTSRPT